MYNINTLLKTFCLQKLKLLHKITGWSKRGVNIINNNTHTLFHWKQTLFPIIWDKSETQCRGKNSWENCYKKKLQHYSMSCFPWTTKRNRPLSVLIQHHRVLPTQTVKGWQKISPMKLYKSFHAYLRFKIRAVVKSETLGDEQFSCLTGVQSQCHCSETWKKDRQNTKHIFPWFWHPLTHHFPTSKIN